MRQLARFQHTRVRARACGEPDDAQVNDQHRKVLKIAMSHRAQLVEWRVKA